MEMRTALPKNIRQIGDVRGKEKIYLEDYVMTYIRKKEKEEAKEYLGIFLGSRQEMGEDTCIFIRGILEVPLAVSEEQESKGRKGIMTEGQKQDNQKSILQKRQEAERREDISQNQRKSESQEDVAQKLQESEERSFPGTEEQKEKTRRKITLEGQRQKGWKSIFQEDQDDQNGIQQNSESREEVSQNSQTQPELKTPKEILQEQSRQYFPELEVQGCCVIGTYPTERMEHLVQMFPESANLLYHLQEQEETLYVTGNGQYERVKGYFVFYEQNRNMQEYLAEVFQENSVEQESLPDRAIKSFREKVKEKSMQKNTSMLKLASSFFVVVMLVIGAIAVTRVEEIRAIRNQGGDLTAENEAEQNQVKTVVSSASNSDDSTLQSAVEEEQRLVNGALMQEGDAAQIAEDSSLVDSQVSDDVADLTDSQATDSAADQTGTSQATDSAAGQTGTAQATDSASSQTATSQVSDNTSGQAGASQTLDSSADQTGTAQESSSSSVTWQAGGPDSFWEEDLEASVDAGSQTSAGVSSQASVDTSSQTSEAASSQASAGASGQASVDASSQASEAASSQASVDASSQTSAAANASDETEVQEAASRQTQAAYVIKSGDTLAEICKRYYGSLDQLTSLCEVNGIADANVIMPGQKIVLP